MLPQAVIIGQVMMGDTTEVWEFRTSPRARRLSARVHLDGRVEIVLPRGASREAVDLFVVRHRSWIEARVAERRAHAPAPFPPRDIELHALGQRWRVHLAGGRGAPRAEAMAPGLLSLRGTGERARLAAALREWLKDHCHGPIEARVAELEQTTGELCSTCGWRGSQP